MSKILVFGHQNPDSDAIGSSVAFAYLAKEAYGLDTEAVALGTPNEETAFVLNTLVWKHRVSSLLLKRKEQSKLS